MILKSINTINLSQKLKLHNINFTSGNFSIIQNKENIDEYILNFRYVNYIIINNYNTIVHKYSNNSNNKNISINKIIKINKNYTVIDDNKLIIPYNLPLISKKNVIKKNVIGIEDIRMFNYNNKIKIIGSCENNNNICVITGEYDYLNNQLININYINPSFNNQPIEKNWVYVEYNNKLQIIYKWFPLQICEIDTKNNLNLVKEIIMPPFFKNTRGSTCGVHYKNEIWFIVHLNANYNYTHFFVVFDVNMNLIKFSNHFKFEGHKIEFCIGLHIEEDGTFLIPYSINDMISKLGIYNIDLINKIQWRYTTN
jgi:hypothetical protein